MTVFGAIVTAISRKIHAFISEVRVLVAKAKAIEKELVETAEADVRVVIARAKAEEKSIVTKVKAETTKLKNELVDDISKL